MSSKVDAATTNRLLDALSPWAYDGIKDRIEIQRLETGQRLFAVQDPIDAVFLPTSATVSLALDGSDGTVGVALIGSDGGIGASLALGFGRSPWEAVVRGDGEAFVVPSELFRSLLRDEPDFHERMLTYARTLFELSNRALACSKLHDRRGRLVRWLLEIEDRRERGLVPSAELLAALTGEPVPAAERFLDMHREEDGTISRSPLEASPCPCFLAQD